jgi:hypothetical protein
MKKIMILIAILLSLTLLSADNTSKKYKIEVEASAGIGILHSHDSLYQRTSGTDFLIAQYAQLTGANAQVSSIQSHEAIKRLIPVNIGVNFNVHSNWYLKMGVEFSSGNTSSDTTYLLPLYGLNENYIYDFEYKISNLMPYLGIETRFSNFGVFLNLGYNTTSFSHTYGLKYSEGDNYQHTLTESFDTKGNGLGVTIGGKYMVNLGARAKVFLKLEYLYLKIGSFSGDKSISGSNSLGETFSNSSDGTIYSYQTNPFGIGWYDFWDVYEDIPNMSATSFPIRNTEKLSLDLSCIRLMLGFSF